jgi:hypothetical protein
MQIIIDGCPTTRSVIVLASLAKARNDLKAAIYSFQPAVWFRNIASVSVSGLLVSLTLRIE